jgi:diguanylate cyclase (GGDEF)-like protein
MDIAEDALVVSPTRRPIPAFGRLGRATVVLPEAEGRRAHLLAWLLVFVLLLSVAALVLVLIVNPVGSPRYREYVALIFGLIGLGALAFGLNWAGHYSASAGLTVLLAAVGPWGSVVLDPVIMRGDFVPLTYVILPVLLSSVLLRPWATIAIAVVQMLILAFVPVLSPATATINWPSLLSFVGFTSVLCILASVVSRRDLVQIDRQTRQLTLSEARLREQSVRDPLTELFNRRYMEETLRREVRRAEREDRPLGVIMLDIDHFKRFNDTLGHAAGDGLLRELGHLLPRSVRESDVVCRYGGEEFVLILPDASLEVARQRAEHLRGEVSTLHTIHKGRSLGAVTISLGVAAFPAHGASGEAVLESADAALYRAKGEGRDRVVVADGEGVVPGD